MGWTSNDLRIEMENAKTAATAAEAIKNYASEHVADYQSAMLERLMSDLTVKDNEVILQDSYFMHGFDYLEFVPEICKLIATIGTFKGEAFFISGYGDEGSSMFSSDGNTLTLKTVYYPNGYYEYLCCDECGEDVIPFEEYEEGKKYICPECGEEIDLSEFYKEHLPEIEELVIKIQ